MAEYTEQEIEMLARAWYETGAYGRDWNMATLDERDGYRDDAIRLGRHGGHPRFAALVRLMREAREQGAAEMRERAARVCQTTRWDGGTAEDAANRVRGLQLTAPQ